LASDMDTPFWMTHFNRVFTTRRIHSIRP
jgi:hypothetical protein